MAANPYQPGFVSVGDGSGPGNQALNINNGEGGYPDLAITNNGSDWYFTVCAIMAASTIAFMGLSFTRPRSDRLFHYITALITLIATIAYFSMGSGLGQVPIAVEFGRPDSTQVSGAGIDGTREIFYVRYIDWFCTTPLLLLDLLLTAGVPWPTILSIIIADEVMVVTGLVGALVSTTYKWGYFVFAMLAFLYVIYGLAIVGRGYSRALGAAPASVFLRCGILTIGIWFLYPLAWGLSEGGNVIHPDGEAIFYGILDIIAKPVFGFLLVFGHQSITSEQLGLRIWDYQNPETREKSGFTNGNGVNGHHHHNGVANGTNGVANGNTATAANTV